MAVSQTFESSSQQAVAQNLLKRRAEMDSGGAASDGRKFALVVEGGAMRGIISGAALVALSELGLLEGFDEVYGTSAGAINAAYSLAGQGAYGLTIYTEDINNRRFINLFRLCRIVDLDYLFDEVIGRRKPLNVARLRASRPRLHISAIDIETGEGRFFDNRTPDLDLLRALQAGSAMPVLDNRPVVVAGRRYFDGGIVLSIPVERAIADGCTDILVLLTRPAGYRKSPAPRVVRWRERRVLRKFGEPFVEAYFNRYRTYNASLDIVFGRTPPDRPVNIAVICPGPGDRMVGRITTDTARLRQVAVDSIHRTARAFGFEARAGEMARLIDPGQKTDRE